MREVGVRVFADWNVLAGRVLRRQPPFRTFLSVTVRHQQGVAMIDDALARHENVELMLI